MPRMTFLLHSTAVSLARRLIRQLHYRPASKTAPSAALSRRRATPFSRGETPKFILRPLLAMCLPLQTAKGFAMTVWIYTPLLLRACFRF